MRPKSLADALEAKSARAVATISLERHRDLVRHSVESLLAHAVLGAGPVYKLVGKKLIWGLHLFHRARVRGEDRGMHFFPPLHIQTCSVRLFELLHIANAELIYLRSLVGFKFIFLGSLRVRARRILFLRPIELCVFPGRGLREIRGSRAFNYWPNCTPAVA